MDCEGHKFYHGFLRRCAETEGHMCSRITRDNVEALSNTENLQEREREGSERRVREAREERAFRSEREKLTHSQLLKAF